MRNKRGTFLGIPYDLRRPAGKEITERIWNPEDQRIITPKRFGWGWTINFYEVLRRLGLKR